eukprot:SM000022S07279  [mRNA]  locus=s22:1084863:1085805:+ [translate_table: standard]
MRSAGAFRLEDRRGARPGTECHFQPGRQVEQPGEAAALLSGDVIVSQPSSNLFTAGQPAGSLVSGTLPIPLKKSGASFTMSPSPHGEKLETWSSPLLSDELSMELRLGRQTNHHSHTTPHLTVSPQLWSTVV